VPGNGETTKDLGARLVLGWTGVVTRFDGFMDGVPMAGIAGVGFLYLSYLWGGGIFIGWCWVGGLFDVAYGGVFYFVCVFLLGDVSALGIGW
jgi:hypothetical protein